MIENNINKQMHQEVSFLIEKYLRENADYNEEFQAYDIELWIPQHFLYNLAKYIAGKYHPDQEIEDNFDKLNSQFELYEKAHKDDAGWPYIYTVQTFLDFIKETFEEFQALKKNENQIMFYPVYPQNKMTLVDDLITFEHTPGTMLENINAKEFYSGIFEYYSNNKKNGSQRENNYQQICEKFLLNTNYADTTTSLRLISKTEANNLITKLQSKENPNPQKLTDIEAKQARNNLFKIMGNNTLFFTSTPDTSNPWKDGGAGTGCLENENGNCYGYESILLFCINQKYLAYLETTFNFWVES